MTQINYDAMMLILISNQLSPAVISKLCRYIPSRRTVPVRAVVQLY